jgi:hypothetical protein
MSKNIKVMMMPYEYEGDNSSVEMQAVKHALYNILMMPMDGPELAGLVDVGVSSINDLMEIDPLTDLKGHAFSWRKNPSDTLEQKNFTPMFLRKLVKLQQYYLEYDIEPVNEWFLHTHEKYTEWSKMSAKKEREAPSMTIGVTPRKLDSGSPVSPLQTPGYQTQVSSASTCTLAVEFQRTVKKSIDDYLPFSNDANWSNWKRVTLVTAHSHGIENVFDVNYVPQSIEEAELFIAHKKFAFLVFMKQLKTPKAMVQLRKYEKDQDAQAVWQGLLEVYENDIAGNIKAHQLRTEIINM